MRQRHRQARESCAFDRIGHKPAKTLIREMGAVDIREIEMKQGNKITSVLAWTFI
ncbi:RlmF-related methyltransferase [Marinobacter sp. M216]|uniref:RlmF-related methyltransferase n=1 Tax=Marinobacter albus TaxID=3030833 RepID=A0ABT7H6L8_9GAMM|nr:RlmF-related methyltransferase [Marinobacter sp. M216]MDK9556001.1 RlmF-related methyltransferase [Marinobacter sp. M216]